MNARSRHSRRPGRGVFGPLLGVAVLGWLVAASTASGAETFVRGDANDDGRATISDANTVLKFLFRGGTLQAVADAGDFDDDGQVNITDAIRLMLFTVEGVETPCDPFPEPGEDATADDLHFPQGDAGEAPDDPASALEVDDAIADADGTLTLRVRVSNSVPIAGYWARISVEGEILSNGQRWDASDLSGTLDGGFLMAQSREESLRLGYLAAFVDEVNVPPGEDVAVLEVSGVCLDPGTPAGEYTLTVEAGELVDSETSKPVIPAVLGTATLTVAEDLEPGAGCEGRDDPEATPICEPSNPPPDPPDPPEPPDAGDLEFLRGDANTDGTLSISDGLAIRRFLFNGDRPPTCLDSADANDDGQINVTDYIMILNHLFLGGPPLPEPFETIGFDPTTDDRIHCAEYTIVDPEETDDLVALGEVEGAPGEQVAIPVLVSNEREVEAFQIVVAYDPGVFSPNEVESEAFLDSGYYGGTPPGHNQVQYHSVTVYPEDGIVILAFIPNLIETGDELPPGEKQHVFNLVGTISPDAALETVVRLDPTNGPDGFGYGPNRLHNELTYRGDARYVSVIPRTAPGYMRIIPDVLIFRGDSNSDGEVDISDARYTLNWLFLGGPEPACLDAADANDDGSLNVSDPIATLVTLFSGMPRIAPPYPSTGRDPTPDLLGFCR
jgi:hypothetical protein